LFTDCHKLQKNFAEARLAYKKAADLKPSDVRLLLAFGTMSLEAKYYEEALSAADRILAIDSQNKLGKRLQREGTETLDLCLSVCGFCVLRCLDSVPTLIELVS
jgi:hypothetical protein